MDKSELEFKRFLDLIFVHNGPLAVIDSRVDEFWHSFILFTPQYRKFCDETFGFFVDHQPRTASTPIPEEAVTNFVVAYTGVHGAIDNFWLEQLDESARAGVLAKPAELPSHFRWSGWPGRDVMGSLF